MITGFAPDVSQDLSSGVAQTLAPLLRTPSFNLGLPLNIVVSYDTHTHTHYTTEHIDIPLFSAAPLSLGPGIDF